VGEDKVESDVVESGVIDVAVTVVLEFESWLRLRKPRASFEARSAEFETTGVGVGEDIVESDVVEGLVESGVIDVAVVAVFGLEP
jgi:hypothetical protein